MYNVIKIAFIILRKMIQKFKGKSIISVVWIAYVFEFTKGSYKGQTAGHYLPFFYYDFIIEHLQNNKKKK